MSWFASIKDFGFGVLDTISASLANPVTLVTKGRSAAIEKTFNSGATKSQNVAKILTTGALAAGAVVGGAAAIGAGATKTISTIAQAVVNNPKKSIAAAIVIPTIASSTKLQQGVENIPASVVNFGSNVGNLVDNPTTENAIAIVKENPVIAGTLAAGAAYVASKAIIPAASVYSNYQNTQALQDNTAIAERVTVVPTGAGEYATIKETPFTNYPPEVVAPSEVAPSGETEAPKKTTKKKKKAKKKTRRSKKKAKKTTKKKKKAKKKTIKRKKKK